MSFRDAVASPGTLGAVQPRDGRTAAHPSTHPPNTTTASPASINPPRRPLGGSAMLLCRLGACACPVLAHRRQPVSPHQVGFGRIIIEHVSTVGGATQATMRLGVGASRNLPWGVASACLIEGERASVVSWVVCVVCVRVSRLAVAGDAACVSHPGVFSPLGPLQLALSPPH